jgi:hypothetical protein
VVQRGATADGVRGRLALKVQCAKVPALTNWMERSTASGSDALARDIHRAAVGHAAQQHTRSHGEGAGGLGPEQLDGDYVISGTPIKGIPLMLHYVASKGTVVGMTRRSHASSARATSSSMAHAERGRDGQ